jgi:CopG family nickel-responsive transcriptional regulator
MQRITITIDDELLQEIDRIVSAKGYQGRSEAMRDIARAGLQQLEDGSDAAAHCAAALVYVYNRDVRGLSRRLAGIRAEHHDLTVSTLSTDLDHDSSFEVSLLRGKTDSVRHLGDHILAERGVRHGRLVLVPVDVTHEKHSHDHGTGTPHEHLKVREAG